MQILRTMLVASACVLMVVSATASASDAIKVTSAWARPPLTPGGAAAAYISLENTGTGGDRLVGIKSDAAKRIMLHTHMMEDGIAKMRQVEAIDLPTGGVLRMRPGGHHVMLTGPGAGIREGARFPLTLTFEEAGEVTIEVEVLSAQASGPKRVPQKPHGHIHEDMRDEIPAGLDTATTKLTAHERYRVTMTHDHPFEVNEMHGCVLRVATPDGKPVANAKIAIDGGMPSHGHGLPTTPRVTKYLGDGAYRVEGMKFNMTGWWELKVDIAGPPPDSVTFNLVLE